MRSRPGGSAAVLLVMVACARCVVGGEATERSDLRLGDGGYGTAGRPMVMWAEMIGPASSMEPTSEAFTPEVAYAGTLWLPAVPPSEDGQRLALHVVTDAVAVSDAVAGQWMQAAGGGAIVLFELSPPGWVVTLGVVTIVAVGALVNRQAITDAFDRWRSADAAVGEIQRIEGAEASATAGVMAPAATLVEVAARVDRMAETMRQEPASRRCGLLPPPGVRSAGPALPLGAVPLDVGLVLTCFDGRSVRAAPTITAFGRPGKLAVLNVGDQPVLLQGVGLPTVALAPLVPVWLDVPQLAAPLSARITAPLGTPAQIQIVTLASPTWLDFGRR